MFTKLITKARPTICFIKKSDEEAIETLKKIIEKKIF